ncbi:MAG: cellulose binding domain-containing protein [Bacillota bacterium]|nr:cellulose binding domain-containing protein [Bacillota bacterium]
MINVGTIMEVYKNEVLVMTVDFELARVKRKPEMFLGQQISFEKSEVIRPQSKGIFYGASIIAAVLMLAIIAIYVLQNTSLISKDTVYAYIDMDINPSIEFLINDENIVQKVKPLNSDGQNMSKALSLKNLPVKEAVKKVISRSQATGILNSNKIILISASLNPKTSDYKMNRDNAELKFNKLLSSLKAIEDTELRKKYSIKVLEVEPDIKKQALENGLSSGRQFIFNKALTEGVNLTLEEARSGVLSTLMKKAKIDEQNNDTFTSPTIRSDEMLTAVVTPIKAKETVTVNPPEKVTAEVKPTLRNETLTRENIINQTPRPISESMRPSDAKTQDLSTSSLKIQYCNNPKDFSRKVDDVIQISSVFNIVNTGNRTINLKDVTFRYYYTIESEKPQLLGYWSQEDQSSIYYRFAKMNNPVKKADYYLEIGFKSGQLDPGKCTEVIVWFNKEDWSIYKQGNDYSYNYSNSKEYYDWKYVTGYISGVLKWGIEPMR